MPEFLFFFLSLSPLLQRSSRARVHLLFGKSTGWKVPDQGKGSSHIIVSTALEISLMNQQAPPCTRPCPTSPSALVAPHSGLEEQNKQMEKEQAVLLGCTWEQTLSRAPSLMAPQRISALMISSSAQSRAVLCSLVPVGHSSLYFGTPGVALWVPDGDIQLQPQSWVALWGQLGWGSVTPGSLWGELLLRGTALGSSWVSWRAECSMDT